MVGQRNTGGTPTPLGGEGPEKTCFLRNEAKSKMVKYIRKIRGVKMLCRLQKNDKWLRFFGNGKWKRCFDKLSMTERREIN
jgi:hypothetical protein